MRKVYILDSTNDFRCKPEATTHYEYYRRYAVAILNRTSGLLAFRKNPGEILVIELDSSRR